MPVVVNYKHPSEYTQALMGVILHTFHWNKAEAHKESSLSNGKLLNIYKRMRLALETGNARNNQEVYSVLCVHALFIPSIHFKAKSC